MVDAKLYSLIREAEKRVEAEKHPKPGHEVDKRALEFQAANNCSYADALRAVLAKDPELNERYFACFNEETRPIRR